MLEYVAQQTGGMTAWGSKDVTNLLPRMVDDFESYYSLAYSATAGKSGHAQDRSPRQGSEADRPRAQAVPAEVGHDQDGRPRHRHALRQRAAVIVRGEGPAGRAEAR